MMLKKRVHVLAPGANSLVDLTRSNLASHRLRLAVAAGGVEENPSCQVSVGDRLTEMPEVLLVGKIGAQEIEARSLLWLRGMEEVRKAGGRVILDYTDNHLTGGNVMSPFYERAVLIAHQIVVPSDGMRVPTLKSLQDRVTVIPDALEYDLVPPKQTSTKIGVWFGHGSNLLYLLDYFKRQAISRYFDQLIICTDSETLTALSKSPWLKYLPAVRGFVWSIANQREALLQADFAFLPVGINDPKKSGAGANRLMTALCLGLPVFTQSIESYKPFRRYYIDLDGEHWTETLTRLDSIRAMTIEAQSMLFRVLKRTDLSQLWRDSILGSKTVGRSIIYAP